jgi:hypothetical protein
LFPVLLFVRGVMAALYPLTRITGPSAVCITGSTTRSVSTGKPFLSWAAIKRVNDGTDISREESLLKIEPSVVGSRQTSARAKPTTTLIANQCHRLRLSSSIIR